MEINTFNLKEISLSEFKSLDNNSFKLLMFLLLPLIPACSLFIGTHFFGWTSGNNQHYLDINDAFKLSSLIYVGFLFVIFSMAIFFTCLLKDNGINKNILTSINYCTYLSLPFVLCGLLMTRPESFLIIFSFLLSFFYSSFMFYSSFHNFIGLRNIKDTNKMVSISITIIFFIILVFSVMLFIYNFFQEYFIFIFDILNH